MPQTPHVEGPSTASDSVRDVVIGMSDGLTVPFALAAGLSGAVGSTGLVVVAGLAEIAAGAIAMGLGGYLAARSDAEHYSIERARELAETGAKPAAEAAEVTHILRSFGLRAEDSEPIVAALTKRPEAWVDFMMRFELGLAKPDPRRALTSALTVGGAYVAGGFIPPRPLRGARERPRSIDRIGGSLRPMGTPHRDARPPCPPASADRSILGHSRETLPLRAARVATPTPARRWRAARVSRRPASRL